MNSDFNPKSDVGADGIAKWLDAQEIVTTQPISRSDTGKESQTLGRQATEASPPRATSDFGFKALAAALVDLGCPAEKSPGMAAQLEKRARQLAEAKGRSYAEALAHLLSLMKQGWAAQGK